LIQVISLAIDPPNPLPIRYSCHEVEPYQQKVELYTPRAYDFFQFGLLDTRDGKTLILVHTVETHKRWGKHWYDEGHIPRWEERFPEVFEVKNGFVTIHNRFYWRRCTDDVIHFKISLRDPKKDYAVEVV
jgi:hypothetical protein